MKNINFQKMYQTYIATLAVIFILMTIPMTVHADWAGDLLKFTGITTTTTTATTIPNISISGQVTYYSNLNPVANVLLTLKDANGTSYSAATDGNGNYTISGTLGHRYTLTPSKSDTDISQWLSAAGASKVARYIVGKEVLTDYQKIAADVTGNGVITGLDASRIARYKVKLISALNDKTITWKFTPVSKIYSVLNTDIQQQDFIAIMLGDVSGAYSSVPRSLQSELYTNDSSVPGIVDNYNPPIVDAFYVNSINTDSPNSFADRSLMQYDFDGDGKINLQDAIYAIREGYLESGIRSLQVVSDVLKSVSTKQTIPSVISELKVTTSSFTIPVTLNQQTTIESIDLGISGYDVTVLDITGITLAGGILENKNYALTYNIENGSAKIVIYAQGNPIAGSGDIAFITFGVKGRTDTSVLISKFDCNELSADGGFRINSTVSQNVKILLSELVIPEFKITSNSFSIPVTLNQQTAIENLDMEIEGYDENVLAITGISLAGGILENNGYILENNIWNNKASIVIYAGGTPVVGNGDVAFINFSVKGTTNSSAMLTKFEVNESSVDGGFRMNTSVSRIVNVSFSHAPILDDTQSPQLESINWNTFTSKGNYVSQIIINGSITYDDGTAAPKAIAVTVVDNTNGVWQYSLDDGTTWIDFTTERGAKIDISAAARLLDGIHKIRFVPNADWIGTAAFTFRAWDKSRGTSGEAADATAGGLASPFSVVTDDAVINVVKLQAIAGVSGGALTVNENQTVTLDGSNSTGVIATYRWKQIEGVSAALSYSMGVQPYFKAPQVSTGGISLTFMLTIEDSNGITSSDTVTISVSDIPLPAVDFKANLVNGNTPVDISFTDMTQGAVNEWMWEFGDGFQTMLQNPTHRYAASGVYTVKLTVKGPGGTNTAIKNNYITVNKIPLKADFEAAPIQGAAPLNVSFTPKVQGEITEWVWNFGDGKTSAEQNPTHIYTSPGTYTVSLTIKGADGTQTETKTNFISVIPRSISGIVTGSDTGVGIADCWVEVWAGNVFLTAATTQPDGNYTITGLAAIDNLALAARPPIGSSYYPQYFNGKESLNQGDRLSLLNGSLSAINFSLQRMPLEGLSGKVHDGQNGIAGIEVNVFSRQLGYGMSAITDQNGSYVIKGLKPSNDYQVFVRSEVLNMEFFYAIPADKSVGEYIPTLSVFTPDRATSVTPKDPPVPNIDIIVKMNQGGSISGHVYTYSSNIPIQGIRVYAWSDALNAGNGVSTDPNGYYIIYGLKEVVSADSQTNGYRVDVSSLDYMYQAYNLSDKPEGAMRVSTGTTGIDFYLKTTSTISGKVTDTTGNPIEGAVIIAKSLSSPSQKFGSAKSDISGAYSITLPIASDYIIESFSSKYPPQYYNQKTDSKQADILNLTSGDVKNVDFMLNKGGVVKGVLKIGNTPAPAGVVINLWSPSANTGMDVVTDDEGRYEFFGLDKATVDYVITVRNPKYTPIYYREDTLAFTWEDAQRVSPSDSAERNLVLSTGLSINGKTTFNGEPISGIRVEAYSQDGIKRGSSITSSGNYSITGLLGGTYTVNIYPENYAKQSKSVVLSTADALVDFVLAQEPLRKISGTITGLEAGKTVKITITSASRNIAGSVQLEGTGKTQNWVSGLKPASDYVAELTSADYPAQVYNGKYKIENADYINLSDGDASNINFTLSSTSAVISGQIIFPGDAVTGDAAVVNVFSRSLGIQRSVNVTVGESQIVPYSITALLPAKDYKLYISSDKYLKFFYDGSDNGSITEENAQYIDVSQNPAAIINFRLKAGAEISGKIMNKDGQGIAGVRVEAYSKKIGVSGSVTTLQDGTYVIKGLGAADDYIVKATDTELGSFYYNKQKVVTDESVADYVTTAEGSPININIRLTALESISGLVTDIDGNSLSLMWIEAVSDFTQTRRGVFSDIDGKYEIKGLPASSDYTVSARPNWFTEPIKKDDIATGSTGINFILNPHEGYTIMGTVMDKKGNPVSNVRVEAWSESQNIRGNLWAVSDRFGKYELKGVPKGDDYIIMAFPPIETAFAFFSTVVSVPVVNDTKNIELEQSLIISGIVTLNNGLAIPDAKIIAMSLTKNFQAQTQTLKDGSYVISSVPEGSDYTITVLSGSSYIGQTIFNQSPGTGINFVIESSGSITGEVKDLTTGQVLPNVLMEAYSKTMQGASGFFGVGITDRNGNFVIKGLKSMDSHGGSIKDYIVTAYSKAYPPMSKGENKVGDKLTFMLSSDNTNKISGTVMGLNGVLLEGVDIVVDAFDTDNHYVSFVMATNTGNFVFSSLESNKQYKLQFTAFIGDEPSLSQWAAQGIAGYDAGVANPDDPTQPAKAYKTNTTVDFRFSSLVVKKSEHLSSRANSGNISIESTTHTDMVSNNPFITVSWGPSTDGTDVGYYYEFNQTADYKITKRNAPPMLPIKTRQVTSGELTGDNVSYYFHVAAVDDRGRIGQTSHKAFRIDTVAPSNGTIIVPSTTFNRMISMTIGIADAKEMYISNIGYGQGGSWEPKVKDKQWELSEGDGLKTIFIQFRDEGGNSANYLVSTNKMPVKGNTIPLFTDQTFTVNEKSPNGTIVGKVVAKDADSTITLTYKIISGNTNNAFAINSSTGDITVSDGTQLNYLITPSYTLTVEVSNGVYSATAAITINVNKPPDEKLVVQNQTFSIIEKSPKGTSVGTIAATGPIPVRTFSLISGNTGNVFAINPNTGELIVNDSSQLNYNTIPQYMLTVQVSDSANVVTAAMTVNVIKKILPVTINWQPQNLSPAGNTVDWLKSTWGTSKTDVFAVGGGFDYDTFQYSNIILHYDGVSWTRMNTGTSEYLYDIWGSSSSNVFAVGWAGEVLRYDGNHWTSMSTGISDNLSGVWGEGSNVFVVGDFGAVFRFDGVNWNRMNSGVSQDLYDIWGSSASNIFAVGDGGTILRFNGKAWTVMNSGVLVRLRGIWGTSDSDVFAVGDNGTILHYNGTSWKQMNSTISESIFAVGGNFGADVFAVGDTGTILHYDGVSWNKTFTGTTVNLKGVWGNSESIVAVGDSGVILKTGN